ncbi:BON domain-containing protein [Paractinoplanes atraurantiacus]|uniref:BON domain-containing protein n=1 Tax=Paractinoplanes atraurantiacus TaxID=1036182 RepID=A0A285GPX7_9ACTN|nr:BON domain-containing protein [Actinoplanes atraurantiacus]SNY25498.1 BON domain-containing protein [Actinoplanes atraurantiacus]
MQPLPDDEFLAQHRRRDPVVASDEVRAALAVVLGLNGDERTSHEPIRVSVQNGVVVLDGTVSSWAARERAADLVRTTVAGLDICNALRVRADPRARRSQDEFDTIVAGLTPSSSNAAGLRRVARAIMAAPGVSATIVFSLALPWYLLVTGWAGVPMMAAILAVTAIAVTGPKGGKAE